MVDLATQIDDAPGCGEPGRFSECAGVFVAPLWHLQVQEHSSAHVEMEVSRANDFSVR